VGGRRESMIHLAKFVLVCGVILFVAWLAGTGRVAYVMVMLWIAAALAYAIVDLVDYEIVKRERRG
jgi:amino acid transporter